MTTTRTPLTVGQVAERFGVTVRTLHHYDEVGLVRPSERSAAGYRLYTEDDLLRLQNAVVYRRLGFPLEEIGLLLDSEPDELAGHLRRQRTVVESRLDELRELVLAIDNALERQMTGIRLTEEEQRELFGDGFSDEYQQEAQQRWGDTDAWKESRRRTSSYTKEQWVAIKAEMEGNLDAFAAALADGAPADGERAMDLAEQARLHVDRWFYPLSHRMHCNLGEMYVADPRFASTYEDRADGLAQYVHDAILANKARQP